MIGGGPAGMMAAIAAARSGAAVRLWEKNGSLGRKLLATGNGRCNFTNRDLDLRHFHGGGCQPVKQVLSTFSGDRTIGFFNDLGVEHYYDDRGRCFPASNEAGSILFTLEQELARLGVEVNTRCEIVAIKKTDNGFAIDQRGQTHRCDAVVLACGGAAAPQFGSNGSGFELARRLGHRITPVRPSLAPVELTGNWFHKLQGVRLDMTLSISGANGGVVKYTDEGLFTQFGLSGPLALGASRELDRPGITCALNFIPGRATAEAAVALKRRAGLLGHREAGDLLSGWLPSKVGRMLVRQSEIDPDAKVLDIPADAIRKLERNMTAFPVTVKSLRGLKEAQVTAGGVDCAGIDFRTMQSKIAAGLFFCGEVVDVDGDSGGYNLQWCWSSGHIAGSNAAGFVRRTIEG